MNHLPIILVIIFAIVIIETAYNESFSSESTKRWMSTDSNSTENIITENATKDIYVNPKFIENAKHRGSNFQLSVLFPVVFFALLLLFYVRCDRLRGPGIRLQAGPAQLGRLLRYVRP